MSADAKAKKKKAADTDDDDDDAEDRLAALQADLDAANANAKAVVVRTAIVEQARKLRFRNPLDAVALVDMSDITVDDEDKVTGHVGALKALAKSRRHLINSKTPPKDDAKAGGKSKKGKVSDAKKKEIATAFGINIRQQKKE